MSVHWYVHMYNDGHQKFNPTQSFLTVIINCFNTDWPIDIRLFELRPSINQLVFAGDRMPLDCRVSNDDIKGIYWYRNGRKVVNNTAAKITVTQNTSEQGLINLSLM